MPPRTIGPYIVLSRIGTGGMGEVFKARHLDTNRIVALKLLSGSSSDHEELERFQREMRVAASLSHWNLVKILDGGDADGTPYLAMEFLEGESLEDVLGPRGRMSWTRSVHICKEVAAGLAELHAHKIIHRDLKPSNVMIRGDTAKLIDFGLAKRAGATQLTAAGQMMGTLPYMAPEMVSMREPTAALDMWALGCMLFRMLTGRLPVECDQPALLLAAILTSPIPDVAELAPETPEPLVAIVKQLLIRDPGLRLQPASALVAALEALEVDEVRTVDPVTSLSRDVEPKAKQVVRNGRWWWPAVAGVLGVCLMVVLLTVRNSRPPGLRPAVVRSSPLASPTPKPCAFDGWRRVEPLLHLISSRRLDAATHTALRQEVSIDLGGEAYLWIHWVRLGRWLASSDRTPDPPASAGAHNGVWQGSAGTAATSRSVMEDASLSVWQGVCHSFGWLSPADQFRTMILATADWPKEGRAWLLLARGFERASRPGAAKLLYTQALKHLPPGALVGWPRELWTAWARALLVVPGHTLEEEWPIALDQADDRELCVLALTDAVVQRKRLEGMLNRLSQQPGFQVLAQEALGQLYYASGDRAAAIAIWEKAWRIDPRRESLCEKLMSRCLADGELDGVRRYLEHVRSSVYLWSTYEYCKGPPESAPVWTRERTGQDVDLRLDSLELYRLLELKRIEDATRLVVRLIEAVKARRRTMDEFVVMDVIGAGSADARVEAYVLENLLDPGVDDAIKYRRWQQATGALCGPAMVTRMNHWFDLAACRKPPPVKLEALRALWLSRRGMLRESLAALAKVRDGLSAAEVYEIVARPIWYDVLGIGRYHEVAEQVRKTPFERSATTGIPKSLLDCYRELRFGDPRQTVRYTRELRHAFGDQPAWILSELWAAAAFGGQVLARTVPRLRCRIRYELAGMWLLDEVTRVEREAARPAQRN